MTIRTVVVDGVPLAVHDRDGPDPPMVLLHGLTGAASTMSGLGAGFAGSRRVISLDLVGHGSSGVPESLDAYTVPAMADHVLGVADVLRLAPFHLVGYSMGGRVGLQVACSASHRLRSLTLIGATAGIVDADARDQRRRLDHQRADLAEHDIETFVDEWMANPLFAGQAALGAEALGESRRQRLATSPVGLARSLRAGGTGSMIPLHDRLARCRVPALLVVGSHDDKFRAVAADLAPRFEQASVAVIDGAGHAAHVEQPQRCIDAIAAFVARVES